MLPENVISEKAFSDHIQVRSGFLVPYQESGLGLSFRYNPTWNLSRALLGKDF